MGQVQCCEGQIQRKQPYLNVNLLNMPDDLPEIDQKPNYLTSRTNKSKRLGDPFEGEQRDKFPTLSEEIQNTLLQNAEIEKICKQKKEYSIGKEEKYSFKFTKTGIIYRGEWKNEKPNGFGKSFYPNGGYYEGIFVDGLPHGYGRFINENGDYYEGEVKFGRGNGYGIYQTSERKYRGLFKDNLLNGQGQEKGEDFFFRGLYQNGERREGILKYQGNIYEGKFEDDVFEGEGKLTTPEGSYKGKFKNGLQHGFGEFTWINGSIYRGKYFKGLREGDGEFYDGTNHSISRGFWKRGVLEGDGEYVEPRGITSRCVWNEGKLVGLR